MNVPRLPPGFLASGRNAGIKNSKADCGVLIADAPAVMAACVTQNRSRAACTARVEAIRDRGGPVRAILAVSGNANALTGEAGREADRALATALADRLGIGEEEVLTAFTGILGHKPPVERIEAALDLNLESLDKDPTRFAESILTTDRVTKGTVNQHTQFLRPARGGDLFVEVDVLRFGKATAYAEAHVKSANGDLIAHAVTEYAF